MTDTPALEMLGVSKRFGTVVALENANFVVRQGTVHALLGENGAGKTTLVRVAYGLLAPDRGTLRVGGRAARFAQPAMAIAAGIGMVHQHPANVPAMTVAENLEMGNHGPYRPADVKRDASELARRVGFDVDPDARVADLSVPAQQRLEILKAIARQARILILDEPTAVLAPAEARDLLGWMRRFAGEGGTVVVITHKLEEARSFTDDLTVLRNGRTVLAQPSATTSARTLADAMLGTSTKPIHPSRSRSQVDETVVASASELTLVRNRGTIAIDRATFEIRRGEILGIVGVDGSGHHELLLALGRRHPVAGGRLVLPERTGLVPEDRHRDAVVLDFTLAENVAINGAGSRRGRLGWKALEARTATLLSAFDVRARGVGDRMSTLSGGNQQKVVLARELGADPELLVIENPTRGLDIRAAAFIRGQIETERDRGAAIALYSSDLDEVVEAADRVLVVHAGRVRVVPPDRSLVGAAMLGMA